VLWRHSRRRCVVVGLLPAPSWCAACVPGYNIYWDNVGGPMLDLMFTQMATFGRIVVCGMISQYNKRPEEQYVCVSGWCGWHTWRMTERRTSV